MGLLQKSMDRVPREILTITPVREDFRHEAFFYATPAEFVAGTAAFIRDGLEADEPTLAVLSAPKIAHLSDVL